MDDPQQIIEETNEKMREACDELISKHGWQTQSVLEQQMNLILDKMWAQGKLDGQLFAQAGQDPSDPNAVLITFYNEEGEKVDLYQVIGAMYDL